jgi:hypothetical protein
MNMRERIELAMRRSIKCDASGLSPAVASVYLVGFEEAVDAILDDLMKPDEGMVEAASQGFDCSRGACAVDWQRDAFTAAIKHAKEGK